MNLANAIETLRIYQVWRRTYATVEDPDLESEKISLALEAVLKAATAAQKLFAQESTKQIK